MNERDRRTLEDIRVTLEAILVEIKRPRHIVIRVLEIAAAAASVLSIIGIAEKAMKWFGG